MDDPKAPLLTRSAKGPFTVEGAQPLLPRGLATFLLLVLFLLLAAIPLASYSLSHSTTPFLYQNIGLAKWTIIGGHLDESIPTGFGSRSTMPAYTIALAQLSLITGMSLEQIQFLPIGGLTIASAALFFMRRWTGSTFAGMLSFMYYAFDPSAGTSTYSVFAYSWTIPLYLIFVALFLERLHWKRTETIVVLVLLFIGANFIHYTIPMWIIVLTVVELTLSNLGMFGLPAPKRRLRLDLLLVFVVVYLGFNQIVYEQVLPDLGDDFWLDPKELIFARISRLFAGGTDAPEAFWWDDPRSPFLSMLTLLQYTVLIGAVAVASLYLLRKRERRLLPAVLVGTVFLTMLADMMAYYSQGWLSLKYVLVAFPLVGAVALYHLGVLNRRGIFILLGLLSVVGMLKFGDTLSSWEFDHRYEYVHTSMGWFYQHVPPDEAPPALQDIRGGVLEPEILAPLYTYGQLLVLGADYNRFVRLRPFDAEKYGAAVGTMPESMLSDTDYLFVNKAQENLPTISIKWVKYEPLSWHLEEIRSSLALQEVYDDGLVSIFGVRLSPKMTQT